MCEIKRVLCIISIMDTGGAETFLMKIYRSLDRKKYQMDFCVNDTKKGFYDEEINLLGGKLFYVPPKTKGVLNFQRSLSELISRYRYEYVLRITSNAMGFLDLKVAKKSGAKRCIVRSSNSSDGSSLIAIIAHKVGTLLYNKYIDVKIAPSDLAAMYTFGKKAYENGQVTILHNAVDLEQYSYNTQAGMQIRNEFKVNMNSLLIGHIGRFSEQKNHAFLLDIFKEICEMYPNSKLMLVGEGNLKIAIQEKIRKLHLENNVIFTGVRSDIASLLSAMDVFVFPSLYEGMPNTIIEAQATGLPCVISDTITKQANITGLVKYKSLQDTPREWAQYILSMERTNRSDTKMDFIRNGYDIESVTKAFERLIFTNQ